MHGHNVYNLKVSDHEIDVHHFSYFACMHWHTVFTNEWYTLEEYTYENLNTELRRVKPEMCPFCIH